MGRLGWWIWGKPVEVTASWLDANRASVDGPEFLIDGHSFTDETTELTDNSRPDMGWTKGDIMSWMGDKGIQYSALSTKAKLLAAIETHLNPPEESITEGEEAQTTGDE
tara:strand:- start:2726 stop:3052 length:327 start_codon:yes stop_codon:yes gene_type:complete